MFATGKLLIPARFVRTRGRARRMCTVDWKVRVSHRFLRTIDRTNWTMWLGIAADEAHRSAFTPHNPKWLTIERPLVDMNIDTPTAATIIQKAGLPVPPKSACWFCPFQRVDAFINLHNEHPCLYQRTLDLEKALNSHRDPNDPIAIIPPTARKHIQQLVLNNQQQTRPTYNPEQHLGISHPELACSRQTK
jgi:hypothetical protein